jgi:hypothetical protein
VAHRVNRADQIAPPAAHEDFQIRILKAQQAFEIAVQKIGQANALKMEFTKVGELEENRDRKLTSGEDTLLDWEAAKQQLRAKLQ